jgi:DNA polymerase-3 subunit delta
LEFNQIIKDLKEKNYKPIYFLCGEEEYFIDKISDFIENSVLDEGEKEFNQTVLYGLETDAVSIAAEAKRFPMMAPYNVVIIKDAQNIKSWDVLEPYFNAPSDSTILVINHKFKKPDGRSKAIKAVKKSAVYFESKKLYENQVIAWVEKFVKAHGFNIDPRATMLLVESVGYELSKLSNEASKMFINLQKGVTIDSKFIEENIGVSKDFNVFELTNALGEKNVLKANKIIKHFGSNEKMYPLPMVLPSIYRYFSQLLLYYTVKSGDKNEAASVMGVAPFFVKDFQRASSNYSVKKIARIMSALRKADLRSKGVGDSGISNYDIMKELVFEILH